MADSLQEAIRECQASISRNKAAQTAVFEDYAEGRISKQEYLSRKKDAARQQEEAAAQYAELTDRMAALRNETCTASDLGRYAFVEELTREMLEVLVREIRISGKDGMENVWNFKIDQKKVMPNLTQAEGHLIGNHTYSHMQLTSRNREAFKKELVRTNEIIEEITGVEVEYVRPPYGSWDKSFEEELNMIPVLWTIDPLDWCSSNVGCITDRVLEKAGENEIILMHDYYDTSVTAAFRVVDELLKEGYVFVTVNEILFE